MLVLVAALALAAENPTVDRGGEAPTSPAIGVERARAILFETDASLEDKAPPLHDKCLAMKEAPAAIGCLIDVRYAKDGKAKKVARELFEKTGSVAGTLPAQDFDGDYRGILHFVPRLAVGANRKHLEWMTASLVDIDRFFIDVQAAAPPLEGGAARKLAYRWGQLELRFFESVKRRTPSAIAWEWTVAYNVSGSLFTTTARVRETLFHEIFHLNDTDHDLWAPRALTALYDRIVAKCGMDTKCLTPYAPDGIIVRKPGGTYYAFMPDNGVREYAADLAKRWYVEHHAILTRAKKGKPAPKSAMPFKCGPPENGEAWRLLVDEFFGGIDLTPACT